MQRSWRNLSPPLSDLNAVFTPVGVGSARGSPLGRENSDKEGAMVLQGKRSLFLGLGLVVALALAVVVPGTASAASTLTGETLNGSSSSGNTSNCLSSTFSVTGTAAPGSPYPGTFEETGTWDQFGVAGSFNATFTITSGTTTVMGSKTGAAFGGSFTCNPNFASAGFPALSYAATIHTPTGNFHDEGTSGVVVTNTFAGAATLTESFTSSLTTPVRLAPTNKDQCKNGGWQGFFKNQGQCVSSFQRQP